MRVAYLSPCWPHDLVANGVATYVDGVRRGLEARGHESWVLTERLGEGLGDGRERVLCSAGGGRSLPDRVVGRVAGSFSRYLGIQRSLGDRIVRTLESIEASGEGGFDLVEIEETFGVGAVVRRRLPRPVVVRLHGPHGLVGPALGHRKDKEFWVRCAAEYAAIRGAAGVSSPSAFALDFVRRFYRLELPEAEVIPNPVAFPETPWTDAAAEPDTILFVGRFDRVKGADVLLDAFSRLVERRPTAQLVFVGPDVGLIREGATLSLDDYLARFVSKPARERITLTGSLGQSEIEGYRRRAAVTVVTSRYETFPMVGLEAIAMGSPLVASRAGGLQELIEHDRTGLCYAPEDAQALAEAVEALLADPGRAATLGAEARRVGRARYHEDSVAAAMEAFYERTRARYPGTCT